jgi:hypothetical protein
LKQIDFPAAVHLPSNEFEASDLPLGPSTGPGRSDCRANRCFIITAYLEAGGTLENAQAMAAD